MADLELGPDDRVAPRIRATRRRRGENVFEIPRSRTPLSSVRSMNSGETVRKLSEMADDAAFERLVTAVLREVKPEYESLIHTGINAEGNTVRAPLDGITFVTGAQPPHMIAAYHTTCDRAKIKGKWLHDPASVKPRTVGKPTAPQGDLLKTAEIVAASPQGSRNSSQPLP